MNTKMMLESTELINAINEWFGVDDFENVMDLIEHGKTRGSFASYEQDTPILRDGSLGIDLREFFTSIEYVSDYEHLTVEELEQYLKEFEGVLWSETRHDNSYNYNGNLVRDIDFKTFENEINDEVLAFFSIHFGLDARAGYTKSFAMKFQDEYSMLEFMFEDFTIADIEFKQDDIVYNAWIRGRALDEHTTVDIDDMNWFDDGSHLDIYDKEYLKDSFVEYLEENEIEFEEGSIKVVTY